LRVATELGAESIAFPAISTGIFRWPVDSAAAIAVAAVRSTDIPLVRFVLFTQDAYDAYQAFLTDR
jgi:O-acetyl-ADP-ribose deacetylase (regulator of RNase III)